MADMRIKKSYSSTPTPQPAKNDSSRIHSMQHIKKSNSNSNMTDRDKEKYGLCTKFDLTYVRKQVLWEKRHAPSYWRPDFTKASSPSATQPIKKNNCYMMDHYKKMYCTPKCDLPEAKKLHSTSVQKSDFTKASSPSSTQPVKNGSSSVPVTQQIKKSNSNMMDRNKELYRPCLKRDLTEAKNLQAPSFWKSNFTKASSPSTTQPVKNGSSSVPVTQHIKKNNSNMMDRNKELYRPCLKRDLTDGKKLRSTSFWKPDVTKASSPSNTQPVKNGSSSIPETQHIKKRNSNVHMTDRDKEIYRLCTNCDLPDAKKQALWEKLHGTSIQKLDFTKASSTRTTQPVKNESSSKPVTHDIKKSNSNMHMTDHNKEIHSLCSKGDLTDTKKQAPSEKKLHSTSFWEPDLTNTIVITHIVSNRSKGKTITTQPPVNYTSKEKLHSTSFCKPDFTNASTTLTTQPIKNGSSRSIPVMQPIKKSNSNLTNHDRDLYRLCSKRELSDAEKQALWEKVCSTLFWKPNFTTYNSTPTAQPIKSGSNSSITGMQHIEKINSNWNLTDHDKEVYHQVTYCGLLFGQKQAVWEQLTGRSDIKIPFIPYDKRPKKKESEVKFDFKVTDEDFQYIWDTIYVRDRKKVVKPQTECHVKKPNVRPKVNVSKLPKTKKDKKMNVFKKTQ